MRGTDYWPFLRAVHITLLPFKPRAHWGKLHMMTREHLQLVYPNLSNTSSFDASRIQTASSSTTTSGHCSPNPPGPGATS
jgi:hypothetical protein